MFKIQTSWDDGNKLDLNIVKLLKKYDLPGIFFVPYTCDRAKIGEDRLTDDEIKSIVNKGFKIGGHTMTHPSDLKSLTEDELNDEIVGCKIWLEDLLGEGHNVRHFCTPKGKYNETVIRIVKESGFDSLRTVDVFNFPEDDDFIVRPTIHVYRDRKEYDNKYWMHMAMNKFDEAKEQGKTFHIWGHSWEIDALGMWTELDAFFKFMKENK